ncbi:hypothetical protein CEUSTIGMA_g13712.t1 [Chlamydomonas eustigma]|uniref:Uncharacterized protein n=1 Tax=Chlamydomonas eustigma TaxID=1157962 RepID=A0A250XU22_9CHLO|nr:hypothetical protein CEUSTIGMA_g13712.t1 [Chlamydomonas eustigma]|eukprot:GAX86300.1 hypothetical protein CEUSTIGMA_g13712.t1 [Chlamydomonas eustigma]
MSASDILSNSRSVHDVSAPILLVSSSTPPVRRSSGQEFVSIQKNLNTTPAINLHVESFFERTLVPVINAASRTFEDMSGRRLYPITIQFSDLQQPAPSGAKTSGTFAIYDFSNGLLVLDYTLMEWIFQDSHVQDTSLIIVREIFSSFIALPTSIFKVGASLAGANLIKDAISSAVNAVFATSPPLWFCLLCPAVLGLIAPLAINLGLFELAGIICSRLQLDDTQCFDLMLGALGVGFVLALAASIPIFFVCRLMECAHRTNTSIGLSSWS